MIAPCIALLASLSSGPAAPSIPYTRFELKNGLEVLVHEDHRVPIVAVDMWMHVGSGDEVTGKTGFAHLFEHMMFQGSKNVPEDKHFDILREAGASNINGTTNPDRTNFFETLPSNQVETALWLESDRLAFLLDRVTDVSLKNQIDVVRNERRQRYDNVPYGADRFATYEALYPEGHPYRYLTIGKHTDLEGAKLEDVRAFFQHWYTPQNATLAIAGDISADKVHDLVEKWFGSLPATGKPAHKTPATPSLQANMRKEVSDPFAKLVRAHWAWHAPKRYGPDDTDLGTAADVLGHEGWGRLNKILVVDKQLAQSVDVWQENMGFSSNFNIAVTLKPGSKVEDVEAIVKQQLLKLLDGGPSADEVRRSVVDTETGVLFGLDEIMSRADQLNSANHFTGDPGYLGKYLEEVRSRTPETVRLAARRWLAKPRVEIVTIPAASTGGAP